MWEKILKGLIKNTPLALVVIGVFLVVLGATGGFDKIGIKVEDLRWRIVLAIMGTVVAGFGGLVIWRGQGNVETSALAKECDPKITSHTKGSEVDEHIRLAGTYKKKPPKKSLAVLELSPIGRQYWFKKSPLFDDNEKQWFADIRVGGEPGKERVLYVAILGAAGQALQDFYFAVEEQTGKWAGIDVEGLTPDIVLCDRVNVRRKLAPH